MEQGINTHCGRQLAADCLLLTCCLLAACFLLACWLLACCLLAGCLLAGCLLAGCLLLLVCWLLAGFLLAACWQVSPIDRELPTTMRVASLFPVPSLPMGNFFFLIKKTSHRQGGNQEAKHIEDGGSLPMGNVVLPKQCPSKVYSNCTQMNIFLNCIYCKHIVLWVRFFNMEQQTMVEPFHGTAWWSYYDAASSKGMVFVFFFNWLYNKLSQRRLKDNWNIEQYIWISVLL